MAPVLNVALSGPRSYNGVRKDYPWVWPEGRRDPGPADIDVACTALWRTWAERAHVLPAPGAEGGKKKVKKNK